jgi:hypothetical protein
MWRNCWGLPEPASSLSVPYAVPGQFREAIALFQSPLRQRPISVSPGFAIVGRISLRSTLRRAVGRGGEGV